jgi:hypothetical protein
MARERVPLEKTIKPISHENKTPEKGVDNGPEGSESSLMALQHQIGNRAVQRLFVQRSSQEPTELDDDTEDRINRERSSGQPLDSQVQVQMEKATGQDLSGVQVHTSDESNAVNRQIGAKAFTTGSDIFFTNGAYQPGSSGGKELLAHELTHVVQQRSGVAGGSGGRMTVNAPHDQYEQEADAVANAVTSSGSSDAVQRELPKEEEEKLQAQEEDEDDKLQMNGGKEEEEEEKLG